MVQITNGVETAMMPDVLIWLPLGNLRMYG
jgi:hypothetical protein